jgi:DNA polymerase-3 subunit alpha
VITATANHPFRTLDGWKNLGDLRPDDRIAAPRCLPVDGGKSWPRHEVIALAGLLSEGNTCHPTSLYFFGDDPVLVKDFADAAACFPETVARVYTRRGKRMEVCVNTGRDGTIRKQIKARQAAAAALAGAKPLAVRSGAYRWAEQLGILRRLATAKRVPEGVFQLCDADLELFVGRLWAGDGFIANADQFVPFYATSSEGLARDVQTLLARLGIVGGFHAKQFKYRGETRPGYTVHLLGDSSIETFLERVTPHCVGREEHVSLLLWPRSIPLRCWRSRDTFSSRPTQWGVSRSKNV